MNRRKFLVNTTKATTATLITVPFITNEVLAETECKTAFNFEQIALPYAFDALEPQIDKETMTIHYTKHHAGYVKNITAAISEEHIHEKDALSFMKNIEKYSTKARNNAGGAWNHNFFWKCMTPGGSEMPTKVSDAIISNFGSIDDFKAKFSKAAATRFGSGWAWLVKDGNSLKIGSTPNQDNPLMGNSEFKGKPLLGLDVWEHAYYLHYQNKKGDYVKNWFDIVNWDFVAKQM